MAYRVDAGLFFFQAEDGIRDLVRSRGLGDVYKRQWQPSAAIFEARDAFALAVAVAVDVALEQGVAELHLSLIHI